MLRHLENEDFNELIKNGVSLVDFYAEWCGPCKMLGPVLESIEDKDLQIIKVDVDKHQELARSYGVMSVPTMFIIKDGDIKQQLVGFLPKEVIMDEVNKVK